MTRTILISLPTSIQYVNRYTQFMAIGEELRFRRGISGILLTKPTSDSLSWSFVLKMTEFGDVCSDPFPTGSKDRILVDVTNKEQVVDLVDAEY